MNLIIVAAVAALCLLGMFVHFVVLKSKDEYGSGSEQLGKPWLVAFLVLLALGHVVQKPLMALLPQEKAAPAKIVEQAAALKPAAEFRCDSGDVMLEAVSPADGEHAVLMSGGDVFVATSPVSVRKADDTRFERKGVEYRRGMAVLALPDNRLLMTAPSATDPKTSELLVYALCEDKVLRQSVAAVPLKDVALLRLGGDLVMAVGNQAQAADGDEQASRESWLINVKDLTVQPLANTNHPRLGRGLAAVVLENGQPMLIGAQQPDRRKVELYDTAAKQWRAAADLPRDYYELGAVALPDGRVLAVGHTLVEEEGEESESEILIWDAASNRWQPGPDPLMDFALSPLRDDIGRIFLSGNGGELNVLSHDMKLWFPLRSESERTGPMAVRQLPTKALRFYWPGGWMEDRPARITEPALELLSRYGHAAPFVDLPNGTRLFAGGFATRYGMQPVDECYSGNCEDRGAWNIGDKEFFRLPYNNRPVGLTRLLDVKGEQWALLPPLNEPRGWHALRLLPEGRVLAVGGIGRSGGKVPAEIWEPKTRQWSVQPNLVVQPEMARRTQVLADGRVLYFEDDGLLTALKVWSGDSVSTVGQLPRRRLNFATWKMPDGRVLVMGGVESANVVQEDGGCKDCPPRYVSVDAPSKTAPALVWDPATKTFVATSGPQFATARRGDYRVWPQPDGRVVFEFTEEKLRFDPKTLQWTAPDARSVTHVDESEGEGEGS